MLADVFIDNMDVFENLREVVKSLALAELRGYIEALEKALIILSELKSKKGDVDTAIKMISKLQELAYEKLDIILSDGEVELLISSIKSPKS